MPYEKPEPDDPHELVGVALPEGDPDEMATVLIEEFIRVGLTDEELLNLFRSPFYAGAHQILVNRGEARVRELIARLRQQWGYWKA